MTDNMVELATERDAHALWSTLTDDEREALADADPDEQERAVIRYANEHQGL